MPIELNPCVKCGRRPKRGFNGRWSNPYTFYVFCPRCGNGLLTKHGTRDLSDAAWNAANPKEGKPNDTQTV